jgi:outer membrane protein assembly factor BamB
MKLFVQAIQKVMKQIGNSPWKILKVPLSVATSSLLIAFLLSAAAASSSTHEGTPAKMEILWQYPLQTSAAKSTYPTKGAPAVGEDGSIYVSAYGVVHAMAADGTEKWKFDAVDSIYSDVCIYDGTIYFVAKELVHALAATDGGLKWKISGPQQFMLAPSLASGADGAVYFMNQNKLCAVDIDGKVKWQRQTGDAPWFAPAFAPAVGPDGTIYAFGFTRGQNSNRIYAFDRSGTLKWTFEVDKNNTPSAPTIDDSGNAYFSADIVGNLYTIDADGQSKWLFKTDKPIGPVVIGQDRTLYFGSLDGNLYALSDNGNLKWQFRSGGKIFGAPAIDSHGNVYFASSDRKFYCVDPNGVLKAVIPIDAAYGSPVIAGNGTIYLLGASSLYAISGFAPPNRGPWPMKRHDAQGTGRSVPDTASGGTRLSQ